jgi:hypothetical protein
MPQAGFTDWREQAEWWQRTCEWWHEQADRERARADSTEAVAKFAWKAVENAEQREAERRV